MTTTRLRLVVFAVAWWVCGSTTAAWAQPTCIVGATVYTVSGEPGDYTVCVDGERITAVSDAGDVPAGATTIDGEGMTLTPGFVETSTQLGMVEIWGVQGTVDTDTGETDDVRAAFHVRDAINPQSTLFAIARSGGLTSAVPMPSGGLISGQGAWIDLAGDRVGDMLAVSEDGGVAMSLRFGPGAAGASRAAALLRLREIFADVQSFVADPEAYEAGAMRDLSVSRLDLEALAALIETDVPAVVSASSQTDLRAAIELSEELDLRMAFVGASDAWAMADELAAAEATVILDPLANLPSSFESLGSREDAAALLDAAGVSVILTSNETHNARVLRQAAGNAVRAGLPWDSALAAVTLRPAELVGVDEDYGSIEVGKVANLVLWSGDPFELSTRVRHVWVRGEEQPLDDRQDALFDRYRESGMGDGR